MKMNKSKSVLVDEQKLRTIMWEKEISAMNVSERCGRNPNWLGNVMSRGSRIPIAAADLLADVLECNAEDFILDVCKPKGQKKDVASAAEPDVSKSITSLIAGQAETVSAISMVAEMVEKLYAQNSLIALNLVDIAGSLNKIADELETKEIGVSKENVQAAKAIIESLTESTGEVTAEKYNRSCDMRSISQKERVVALDESNCQYQWRTQKNGEKSCFVVRGC